MVDAEAAERDARTGFSMRGAVRAQHNGEVRTRQSKIDDSARSRVDVIKGQLASAKRNFAKRAAYKMLMDTQARSPPHAHEELPLAFWKHNGVSLSPSSSPIVT